MFFLARQCVAVKNHAQVFFSSRGEGAWPLDLGKKLHRQLGKGEQNSKYKINFWGKLHDFEIFSPGEGAFKRLLLYQEKKP